MKKLYFILILIAIGITQIFAQNNCFNCDSTTKAFTIGTNNIASGGNSFVGGINSYVTSQNGFVFGNESNVAGLNGIALGSYANVLQSGAGGIAIGNYVKSNAANSYVFGMGTGSSPSALLTNGKENSIMFGVSNKPTLTIFQPQGAALGYLGIGTDDPEEQVHVKGKLLIDCGDTTYNSRLRFKYLHANFAQQHDERGGSIPSYYPYYWDIYSDNLGLKFYSINNSGVNTQRLIITENGSVGIGVTNPLAKLDVGGAFKATSATIAGNVSASDITTTNVSAKGNVSASEFTGETATINGTVTADELSAQIAKISGLVCAKEVRVALTGSPCWPDYVFGKNYKLPTLNEVEQFITENQHLPNVPSAAEVTENGIELGEMNAILLQKVEELTLYIIALQKQIDELKNR